MKVLRSTSSADVENASRRPTVKLVSSERGLTLTVLSEPPKIPFYACLRQMGIFILDVLCMMHML